MFICFNRVYGRNSCFLAVGQNLATIFAAGCYASTASTVVRCPSIRPSVTFVDSVETTG